MKKRTKEAHTSTAKIGQGDWYGSAIKNPVGKPRDVMGMSQMPKSKLKKPPKSLA